jgi:signal transduction histidine kinase
MKIRIRLTLWYFIVTLTILLVFSLGTYVGMERLLYSTLDKELGILTETITRSYDPFFNEFEELSFTPETVSRYSEYYIVLYDRTGVPRFASQLAQRVSLAVPLTKAPLRKGYTTTTRWSENQPPARKKNNGEVTLRVLSHHLVYENHTIGWLLVGLPIERIHESMQQLLWVLLSGIFVGVILISTGGYFLTRKALNPVNRITQKAQEISHSHLEKRIEVINKEDELGQLSTVLNDLLQRLQKAFESQRLFMADAAHELKTPLSILRANWESEINNPTLSLEIKEKIVQDIETISRLSHMINNLLLLSQTEFIETNFEFNTLRLDEVIQEVIVDTQMLTEIKSQEFQVIEIPPITLQGDKNRLYQLFFNLIDNAINYTPEEGRVSLTLRSEGEWNIVDIRDNGPGIPPEDLPHIFERFYRVQKDRARRTGGSGLGLSICKHIVEAHKGTIEVESKIGMGTLFRVKLPVS